MTAYKLDNKIMDEHFLAGKVVICEAVLSEAEYDTEVVKAGKKIVILLSTGKKYMGEVLSFDHIHINNHIKGKLEITRYPKTK